MKTAIPALSALALCAAAPAWSQALPACPFKAAELSKSLGAGFQEGKVGMEIPAAGMVLRDCRYQSRDITLMVKSTVFTQPADARKSLAIMAGKLTPLPNDPDGAVVQSDQGDLTSPALHYARQGVAIELRILGIYYKGLKSTPQELRDMQARLAGLRRVP